MKANSNYSTSDFYLASFLKAKGVILSDHERYGRRVTFIFEDRGEIRSLIKDFYNKGIVEVNPFVHAINDLKALIYNL